MEKLKCDCCDDQNHFQYVDQNSEVVIECRNCNRFIKVLQPQQGIPQIELVDPSEQKEN